MKKTFWAAALVAACAPAAAKEKLIPLAEADATTLSGKKVALTLHERPSFTAMTAGKAGFGLFGAGAMIAAGNKLVEENDVRDPAEIVRAGLAAALRDAYAVELLPADTVATKAKAPKEIAALHPEADYVFDVRSGGWMFAYYPTRWASYWVGYSVQVQLVDTRTARQVSNMACNASTHENPVSPSRDQLLADQAKLLKDVTASLGWTCVQLLAREQFHFTPDQVAATPPELADPLAAMATPAPAPAQPATDAASAGDPPVAQAPAAAPEQAVGALPEGAPAGPPSAPAPTADGSGGG